MFLTLDATRHAPELAEAFRRRALAAALAVAALGLLDVAVLQTDTPSLVTNLTSGSPALLAGVSVAAGLASLALLVRRHYLAVRVTAGLATTGLLWACGAAQYPTLLPGTTVTQAPPPQPCCTPPFSPPAPPP